MGTTHEARGRLALVGVVALIVAMWAVVAPGQARADGLGGELYRPAIHFTPQQNWMNDPNGLLYYRGEYHLFYQYNPSGNVWGNMSWGHAVSPDLVHWTQLPVAIPQDDQNMAFSGSAVIDYGNTSGFGQPGNPAMVAIYTAASKIDGYQRQAIAYSLDDGRTFTKAGIVLATPDPQDPNAPPSDNFRDPKVFWYAQGHEWLMTAVLSAEHEVVFYSSPDLKHWTRLSAFGPAHATGGVWECPDFFPLPDPTDPGHQKWVLIVNLNPGGVAGGSGVQYFVGDFDGTTFTADGVPYTAPSGTSLGNFDDGTFDGWTSTGSAFGTSPATGALDGQLPVSGFAGAGFVDGFHGGDGATGTLRSPDFQITQAYLNFLVGGGDHPYVPGSTPGGDAIGTAFANFEGSTWGDGWSATGDFSNAGPVRGALAGQQQVTGFDGAQLVNTFTNGDGSQGTITSPTFTIGSHYIDLLVGGGNHPWGAANPTSVNLVVNGQVVDSATGQDSEALDWASWDVSQYQGQQATIQIVDQNSGGWGHLLVDQISFADNPAPTTFANFEGSTWGDGWSATGDFSNAGPVAGTLAGQQTVTGFDGARLVNTFTNGDAPQGTITSPTFTIGSHYIDLLVGGGNHPWGAANPTSVNLVVNGQVVDSATGQDSEALDWASWDVSQYQGQQATIQIVDQNSGGWGHLLVDSINFSAAPASPVATDTSVRLVVDGQVVRDATGADSEALDWTHFDVANLQGKTAHLELVDNNTTTGEGAWGHLLADQFEQSATPAIPAAQQTNWLDYGADDYAAVTFNNAPDGKRILIGWMNNWSYGGDVPTSPWRSAMTLPKELGLVDTPDGLRLTQHAVAQVDDLAQPVSYHDSDVDVTGTTALPASAAGQVQRVDVSLLPGTSNRAGITVLGDDTTSTVIGYDSGSHQVYVDRRNSGDTSFDPSFPSISSAPVEPDSSGRINLTIYLDRSSVEVFAQDGTAVLTDSVFPDPGAATMALFADGGTAQVQSITVTPLAAAMFQNAFLASPAPTIDGTPDVGYSVSADPGTWSPQPSSFAYQWAADGVDIPDATEPTFVPSTDQVGKYLTVTVTASRSGYEPTTSISAVTGPVAVDTTPPTLVGLPSNQTLEATGSNGAIATWTAPTATDLVDPHPSATCDHRSGDTFPLGTTTVSCQATDQVGNASAAQSFTVTVVDTTPPTIAGTPAGPVTATATSSGGAVVTYVTPTATDLVDGSVPVTCDHASATSFPLGDTVVTCTATDAHANKATARFTVRVTYSWSGVLQPVNTDGSSIFKLGRTVPVIFALTGPSAKITDATATLAYARISSAVTGTYIEATSTAAASSGNAFRYDASNQQYVFNWSTQGLSAGTYLIKIDLGDGVTRTVQVSLR